MKTTLSTKGFNLHMMGLDNWVFDDFSGSLFDGSFRNVVQHMVSIGFLIKEIDYGVEEILKMNHDIAHFGTYKCFMYTSNRKTKVA